MDVKAQGNTTLSCYPWLLSYRNGELQARWQYERDAILAVDTRLSQARAGMLARAKLTVLIVDEYAAFEQYALARCTKSQSACLTEEEDALYTWLVEQWNLRDHLVGVAQVSSYLPDEDLYRSHSCEERWWESLFSSLHTG
jgi:hypothetical protein